jgi:hypothetical protein
MSQTKFYIDDVPKSYEVARWMRQHTNWVELMSEVKPRRHYGNILAFKIQTFNPAELTKSIEDAFAIYGDHGWRSDQGASTAYTGFSMVYNPDHIENCDPHASTLGTSKNSIDQFYYESTQTHTILKNSYFDGYGFNTPTPASLHGALGQFMQRSLRSRVRSRCSVINGYMADGSGWHKDEPIFVNLRLNIPIQTSPTYFLQLEKSIPVHLDIGWAYTWDTNIAHQVFSTEKTHTRRIHLVLGFSPWWDYLPEERAWIQNTFYGRKHPFDMLADGDVFSGLIFDDGKVL